MNFKVFKAVDKKFIKELTLLINKYSIDSFMNMHDFVLAELIEGFLQVLSEANLQELELIKDQGLQDIINQENINEVN